MTTLLNLFLLTTIICFVIDCSGIMTDIRKAVANKIYKKTKLKVDYNELKLKPIGCSLCMTWWAGIIYICIIGEFTFINLAIVALLALLSSNISGFMFLIKDILATIENWLQKLIMK